MPAVRRSTSAASMAGRLDSTFFRSSSRRRPPAGPASAGLLGHFRQLRSDSSSLVDLSSAGTRGSEGPAIAPPPVRTARLSAHPRPSPLPGRRATLLEPPVSDSDQPATRARRPRRSRSHRPPAARRSRGRLTPGRGRIVAATARVRPRPAPTAARSAAALPSDCSASARTRWKTALNVSRSVQSRHDAFLLGRALPSQRRERLDRLLHPCLAGLDSSCCGGERRPLASTSAAMTAVLFANAHSSVASACFSAATTC